MKRFLSLTIFIAQSCLLLAQGQLQIIKGATIHIGNGNVITNGVLIYQGGKIVKVGNANEVPIPADVKVIDATGKQIYPGIICLNTLMGLNEIDAVRATRDYAETGNMNANTRTLIAYNTDSKILPTALFNGILLAQAVPQGGTISGQSSVMKTAAWNWEDAQIKADDGVHLFWPELHPWGDLTKQQERLNKEIQHITEFFAQAVQYASIAKPEDINLRLEAMKGVLQGTKRLYLHVSSAESIIQSVNFCNRYPTVKKVLVGAEEAYQVIEFIKVNQIPVVLNNVHRLPKYNQEDVDLPYKLPAILTKAGITVALGNNGSWESRNVMFQAGTAAAYGLTKEEALMTVTLNAAKICGIEDRVGSLEVGKDATFVISAGDLLDMNTNQLSSAVINGQPIDLTNDQQRLYQKYMNKYELK